MLFLDALGYALSCAIMPRFIISIRELYDRDLQDRWQGIDTGFGRCSEQFSSDSENVSATAFADIVLRGHQANDLETIELEEVTSNSSEV